MAGCTSVHVYDKNSVTVTNNFGLAVVELSAKSDSVLLSELKSLGLIYTPTGLTLGWRSELLVAVPEWSRCQTILWIENPDQLKVVQSLLKINEDSLENICTLTKGGVP